MEKSFETKWPVFSERFGKRQPAFIHYRDWTDMIARGYYETSGKASLMLAAANVRIRNYGMEGPVYLEFWNSVKDPVDGTARKLVKYIKYC